MAGVMLIEAGRGGAETNPLRFPQGAGDEDLGHHDVLVLHRVMLADPELAEAKLLGADDQLQVLVVALPERLRRVMEGHDEHAVLDLPVAAGVCRKHGCEFPFLAASGQGPVCAVGRWNHRAVSADPTRAPTGAATLLAPW